MHPPLGAQVLHGAPHSLPAHGSPPLPDAPLLLEPPPETPPFDAPPFVDPPFPVSPAAGSPSPSESVDCPPHAPAMTNSAPTAKTCRTTPQSTTGRTR
jgi:hypothetical protein